MNFTDVDDKTIAGAQKAGMPLREYTDQYIAAFREDAARARPRAVEETPRATDEANLRGDGRHDPRARAATATPTAATARSTSRSRRCPTTASWRGSITTACRPARASTSDDYAKEDARDFVLWKATKPGEPTWDCRLPARAGPAGTSSARRWRCGCSASRRSTSTPAASI